MVLSMTRECGLCPCSPDNSRSCCPQFTIRLAVSDFKPSKKHRQVVNRWNRYLSTGTKPGDKAALAQDEPMSGSVRRDKGKAKASAAQMDFWQTLTECEEGWGKTGVHRFEVYRAVIRVAVEADGHRLNLCPQKPPGYLLSSTRSIKWRYTKTTKKISL